MPYVCTFFQMDKSDKLAFSNSTTIYTKKLELVTIDLKGPAPVDTNYGFKYYISFIDAYSRCVWIYFLKSKFGAYNAIIQFIALAGKQADCQVKTLQIDGVTEFYPLKEYFQKKGILHRTACPYNSNKNDLIERKHRHIVETGLTLLAQTSLPQIFLA